MSTCPVCGSENNIDVYKGNGRPRYALQRHHSRESALECLKEDVHFVFCVDCQFAYNKDFNSTIMGYEEDIETSRQSSEYFNQYLTSVCKQMDEIFSVTGKRIVELGCGDGQFLTQLRKLFVFEGFGFDPSLKKSRQVSQYKDLTFIPDYYQSSFLNKDPDIIVLRHVLEHIAVLTEFLTPIVGNDGSSPSGIYVEVPDWEWIVANDQIMMFSNDHCSYYSKNSLNLALSKCGFKSERICLSFADEYLQYFGRKHSADEIGSSHLTEYSSTDLIEKTKLFMERIPKVIERFESYFSNSSNEAVLWGAGGKGTILLSTLGISYHQLPFVVDSNPNRHNTYIPVTGQQVIAPEELKRVQPRYVLVTNPSYCDEIAKQLDSLNVKAQIIVVK